MQNDVRCTVWYRLQVQKCSLQSALWQTPHRTHKARRMAQDACAAKMKHVSNFHTGTCPQTPCWQHTSCAEQLQVTSGSRLTHKSSRSALTLLSTSMILEPARSCMTSPDVTMGLIPSSMQVPRLLAMMTRAQ